LRVGERQEWEVIAWCETHPHLGRAHDGTAADAKAYAQSAARACISSERRATSKNDRVARTNKRRRQSLVRLPTRATELFSCSRWVGFPRRCRARDRRRLPVRTSRIAVTDRASTHSTPSVPTINITFIGLLHPDDGQPRFGGQSAHSWTVRACRAAGGWSIVARAAVRPWPRAASRLAGTPNMMSKPQSWRLPTRDRMSSGDPCGFATVLERAQTRVHRRHLTHRQDITMKTHVVRVVAIRLTRHCYAPAALAT